MTDEPVRARVGLARLVPRGLPDELGVVAALVLLAVVIGILRPTFFQPYNLLTLVRSSSFFGIMALGMVFLLALGDIDLSVGSNFNFVAVMAATAMVAGITPWLAALFGIVFGALLGVVNGILAVGLRVPVIIVTLGTLSMFRGLALVVNGSKAVIPTQVTSSFFLLANGKLFGFIPVVAIVFVLLAVVLHFLLHRTRFGYRVQAIGSNPEAARLVGIPIGRTRIQVLALMGAACGVAGVHYRRDAAVGWVRDRVRRADRRADHCRDHRRPRAARGARHLEHLRHRWRHRSCGCTRPPGETSPSAARAQSSAGLIDTSVERERVHATV